jgi:hypothetical protein
MNIGEARRRLTYMSIRRSVSSGPELSSGSIVPRYYIDIRSHFGIDEDPSGIELPDIAAAKSEAVRIARELLRSWAAMPPLYSNEIMIEIVGEDLRPVLIIPCLDVIVMKP